MGRNVRIRDGRWALKFGYSTLAAPDWTVEECVEQAAELGYDGIEWRLADGALLSPSTPPGVMGRIKTRSAEQRIDVVCLDTSCTFVHDDEQKRREVVEDAVRMAEWAAELGAPSIRVFGGRLPEKSTWQQHIGPASEALAQVCDAAGALGVGVLIETHDDWSLGAAAGELARASGALVLWDILHPIRHGESPTATMRMLENFVGLVHVKDARQDGASWTQLPLGKGRLPIDQVAGLLRDHGYDGYVCAEVEKKWHPELPEPEETIPGAIEVLRDKFTFD